MRTSERPSSHGVPLQTRPHLRGSVIVPAILGLPAALYSLTLATGLAQSLVSLPSDLKTAYAYFLGCLLAGGFGFGLLYVAYLLYRRGRAQLARQTRYPDAPWYWREDWHRGLIVCRSRVLVISMVVFAVVSTAVVMPLSVTSVPRAFAEGNTFGAVFMLYMGVMCPIQIVLAYRAVRRYRSHGKTEFRVDTLPARPGSVVAGQLSIGSVVSKDTLTLTLSQLQRRTKKSFNERRQLTEVLWQDEYPIDPHAIRRQGDRWLVPVRIALPADGHPTTSLKTSDGYAWQLKVSGRYRKQAFEASFEFPVFDQSTEDEFSNPRQHQTEDALKPRSISIEELAQQGIDVRSDPHGFSADFTRGRNLRSGWVVMFLIPVLGVAFSVIAAMSGLGVGLSIGPGLVALTLLLLYGNDVFGHSTVHVRKGELVHTGGWLLRDTRRLTAGEIRSIDIERGLQSNQKLYCRLVLQTRSGETLTLAGGLRTRGCAEWLRDRMLEALGR